MEIKGIKYIGPIYDGSGYAKACRGNIIALHKAGIPIVTAPISFEHIRPDLGEEGKFLKTLEDKKVDYNILIMHSTPEFWARFKEKDVTNIGYTIWETSRLHPDWPKYINESADKVLVGCDWNIQVFKESGVEVPLGVVPHGINTDTYEDLVPYDINGMDENAFVFYDIFQWTERKNPISLLHAYWYAFQNNENTALVLKTYKANYSEEEVDSIRNVIKQAKKLLVLDNYPKVYLIPNILKEDELNGLHARGDCYISLDRGEGFGLGPFAAGACGNPIIVTGWGGVTQYANEENSYLVENLLSPVSGMPWSPWYRGDQLWAEPNILHAAELMRHVYNNKEEAKEKGKKLQKHIKDNFNWTAIGNKLIEELNKI